MSYTLQDLNPANPILVLEGISVELSLLSLNKTVRFQELYGEVSDVFAMIKKDPTALIKVMWELVKEKTIFENKFLVFEKSFCSGDVKTTALNAMKCWNECVTKSMPIVINKQRANDLAKLTQSQTELTPCYSRYYDSLAKRYGLSMFSFYEMTLRQLSAQLKTIGDESYSELEVQASLMGRELKPRMIVNDISEEEDKEQDDDANDMLAQLQEKHKAAQQDKDV